MKKIFIAVLITIFTLAVLAYLFYFFFFVPAEEPIGLALNNEVVETPLPLALETEEEKVIIYVPALYVSEKLGFETDWNNQNGILTVSLGDFSLEMPLDSRAVSVNGLEEEWEAPLKMIDDILYMPLYPAARALGVLAFRDEEQNIVKIDTPRAFDPPPETVSEEEDLNSGPLLHVAYPPAADPFYYYDETLFVFGTTQSFALVDVKVNGEPVELLDRRSGNFLTMIEFPRGQEFVVTVEATGESGTTRVERTVLYPDWWQAMPAEPLAIHSSRVVPADRQVLREGESLHVAFQGSPGGSASYQVGSGGEWRQMTERSYPGGPAGNGGIYTASFRVSSTDIPPGTMDMELPVSVKLDRGGEQISRTLPGSVVVLSDQPYKILEVRPEQDLKNRGWLYTVNTGQLQLISSTLGGSGYPTSVVRYLVEGARYRATGAFGEYYRVDIGGSDNYLVHRSTVFDTGVQDMADPLISGLELREDEKMVQVRLLSNERFHFSPEDAVNSLALNFYGTAPGTEPASPALTKSVNSLSYQPYAGEGTGTSRFRIEVDYDLVGFKTYWEENDLLIELYKPFASDRDKPLEGKVIIVDPGHGGVDTGAPGPGKLNEKDVVLAISLYLQEMLIEAGAEVVMTREDDHDVNLYDRPERIDRFKPDLFISIHANAHAAGAPATEIHGIMILYNYAHNERLADIMLETMVAETTLPEFRTWRRNIAVIRHPHVPSVLVEAGYMMHPHDNWYLLHPQGQKDIAAAIIKGVENYFLDLK